MSIPKTDPSRFDLYRESLATTITRTGLIALVLGSIGTVARLGRVPSSGMEWYGWLVLVLFVSWISFGGHWVELFYLNFLRPRIARLHDGLLILVRVAIWLVGGAILFLGAVTTRSLLSSGDWPTDPQVQGAVLYGGPMFVVIELVVHLIAVAIGRPSFWNLRG